MHRSMIFVVLAGLTFVPAAQAAPHSLYRKTLRVTWSEARSQRVQGEGAFKSVSIPLSFPSGATRQAR